MASTNVQFSVAVHVLAGLASRDGLTTSEALASSVNTNAVVVKRVLSKLAKAHLIETVPGKSGGCSLARNPREITLFDVYAAVEAPRAFAVHTYPVNRGCEISSHIKPVLEDVLVETQASLEKDLKKTTIKDVLQKIQKS